MKSLHFYYDAYSYGSYNIIIIINSQLKGASVQRLGVPTHADSDESPEGQFYVEKLLAQRRKVICIMYKLLL